MWQVFVKVCDGYEDWTQELPGEELPGEVFTTEAEASARVDELDRSWGWGQDYHFYQEV